MCHSGQYLLFLLRGDCLLMSLGLGSDFSGWQAGRYFLSMVMNYGVVSFYSSSRLDFQATEIIAIERHLQKQLEI